MTSTTQHHWLFSPQGASIRRMNIRGQELGILGLNTAWLSVSDGDRGNLSPGRSMVEKGLDALQEWDVRIVLGHHPID
jgi:hypothetical protein